MERIKLTLEQKKFLWEELAMFEVYQNEERESFEYWKDFEWSIIKTDECEYFPYSFEIKVGKSGNWCEWDLITDYLFSKLKDVKE